MSVEPLIDVAAEAIGATIHALSDAEPRRRRWKIARMIGLLLAFGLILGIPIALLLR
ncbi:hypothetical protein P1X14_15580 [Sphingomonas sp. AOB5]|uniref:hypothetical protein n=1 Tax=Sphingomonas sp. AOB5 TaxID=3034017 RepID=UPI0023F666CB|nr:hypothetical protein [Sphingomonas sp. AOB5]MDF7776678.1 hypothetical protein [Sphingomonas sp. AOB5]